MSPSSLASAGWFASTSLAAAAMAIAALTAGSARANDACTKRPGILVGIPDCEIQPQVPVKYGAWDTKGWAYYCKGDYPYFWGVGWSEPRSFTITGKCFEATENAFAQGDDLSKFDATFTNCCLKSEELELSLACSSQNPRDTPQ